MLHRPSLELAHLARALQEFTTPRRNFTIYLLLSIFKQKEAHCDKV